MIHRQRPVPAPMDCGEIGCDSTEGRAEESKILEDVGDVAIRACIFALFDFGKVFEEFFFR
eukprot:9645217-Ditylum_brightwellii.AAC.1